MWRISAADGLPKTIPAVSVASTDQNAAASGAPRSLSRAGPVTWVAFPHWRRQPRRAKKESSYLTSSLRVSTWHIPNKRTERSRRKRSARRPNTSYTFCIRIRMQGRFLYEYCLLNINVEKAGRQPCLASLYSYDFHPPLKERCFLQQTGFENALL